MADALSTVLDVLRTPPVPVILLAGGLFGFLSSIPQGTYFGSFGLGITLIEKDAGGWNHCNPNGKQPGAKAGTWEPLTNAWMGYPYDGVVVAPTTDCAQIGVSGSTYPSFLSDKWWSMVQIGLGLPVKGTYKTIGFFGSFALWPFVIASVLGFLLGGSPFIGPLI